MTFDSNIIKRLQSGDQSAMGEVYDQYASTLYGVALKIVQDEAQAADVVQDAFVRIWKNIGRYDNKYGTFFTWMLNITRNRAIDVLRSNNTRRDAKNQMATSSVYNIGYQSIRPEHVDLKNLVEGLDPKFREVIELVYFQGYTQAEAHEALGIPLGTVKTRIRSALQQMRKLFDVQFVSFLLALMTI